MNLTFANDNAPAAARPVFALAKFVVGKTYGVRSICDHDCIFYFEIVKRSAKTVTIKAHGREVRRTIRVYDSAEHIDPHGRYSMSPVLSASGKL